MAAKRICSISNCGKPTSKMGWCASHYSRWKRHGSPLAGHTFHGEPKAFLDQALISATDDCIKWPFGKDLNGRGTINLDGRLQYASRVVCELAYGAPATLDLEASHYCGKGHEGCINPRHLRWATRTENHADKILHGTILRGSRNPLVKLQDGDVREIRKRIAAGEIQSSIAKDFGVTRHAVSAIACGKSWSWLE